jgi:hypothetical protein
MTLEELSRIYIKEVFVRHRVLTKIISDRAMNLNSYVNSILSTDRRINGKTELDIRTVSEALCQLYAK